MKRARSKASIFNIKNTICAFNPFNFNSKVGKTMIAVGLIAGSSIIQSCGGEKKEDEDNGQHKKESVPVEEFKHEEGVQYSVPTPNELFAIIRETGVGFDENIMNPTDNVNKYSSKRLQSINFGVYSADLAYASSFKNGVATQKYYGVVKELGDRLGVMGAFDKASFDRLESNLDETESDSLLMLSNETYYKAYNYLEENDRGPVLAMIVIGGWIEGLHIMTNLKAFEEGGLLSGRIGEQKLVLDNLLGFLMNYMEDPDVADTMEDLAEIEGIFSKMEAEIGKEVETVEENGKYLFTGGAEIKVTKADFEALRAKVSELRAEIIGGN